MKKLTLLTLLTLLLALSLTLPALARGRGRGRNQGPQPARVEACAGHKAGEACTFTSPRGKRTGTCQLSRSGNELVCRGPAQRGRGGR